MTTPTAALPAALPAPAPACAGPGRVAIDIWSDYVCPFCYLELPVLRQLVALYGAALELHWHPFELRPEPAPTLPPDGDYLRATWARAVYPMALERGLTLHLPPVQPRSNLAMQAAEFAREVGGHAALHEALFKAFFEDGRDLGQTEVLLDIGAAAGLDRAALRQALAEGRYRERVAAERSAAERMGLAGVPLMVVRRANEPLRTGVDLSGAQPFEAVNAQVQALLQPAAVA